MRPGLAAFALLGFCFVLPAWGEMGGPGGGGLSPNNNTNTNCKKQITAGSDTHFKWTCMDINQARDAGKPIAVYIFDPEQRINVAAQCLEGEVFANPGVQAAFANFTMIKLSARDKSWPDTFTQPGQKGAALLLLTCDATQVACFNRMSLPRMVKDKEKGESYPEVVAAAQRAVSENSAALARMKKNPPAKFVPVNVMGPGAEAAAVEAEAAKEAREQKRKEENLVPGLKDRKADADGKGGEKGGGRPAEKKSEPRRRATDDENE
jgi:hypothetical protein